MPSDLWRATAAALPLVVLLVGLLRFGWSGARAGSAALLVATATAATIFATPPAVLAVALARAGALALHVLYIIWAALLLYRLAEATGAIRSIGQAVAHLTEDHILQLLIVGFAFSSFLQGVAGFGVPVAVTAPLLVGLGFRPLEAAAVPLVGHAWAVTLGDMASSFQALRAVTGLPPRQLGVWIAALLGLAAVATGFAIAHLHAGSRPFRRAFGAILVLGVSMGGVQLLLAVAQRWIIASFGAGMVGLVTGMGLARLARRRGPGLFGVLPAWPPPEGRREPPRPAPPGEPALSFHAAFLPYYVLIVVVGAATLVSPLHRWLERVVLAVRFPATVTGLGWQTAAAVFDLAVIGHPGALLVYTTVIAALLFRWLGHRLPSRRDLWDGVAAQGVPTTWTILALVGVAMVMTYSGMTFLLARTVARAVGPVYPFLSPFVGLLGTVVTGSNTNSNVLFGALQRDAAGLLAMDPVLMAALQSAGGALGSMVAPAKVVLATATTGLTGQEGVVIRRTLPYALGMAAGLGAAGLVLEVW
ncbi:MAG: L-lactate permease [Armatimonadota bacterium]|nr:L-lactate permease [Armatimonadota bacterium]MDR7537025.1 L-lactate permease [Armatimonadota bacterium]